MKKKSKYKYSLEKIDPTKGSMSIEAGITLSMLILLVTILLVFIRSQQIVEAADQCMFEASKYIQSKSLPLTQAGLVEAIYLESEVKKKFDELMRKKNINPKLCDIRVTMKGENQCLVKGEVKFSFGTKAFFQRNYFYDVILSGVSVYGDSPSFTVTCHGQRFHLTSCHVVSGKEGLIYTDIENAIKMGKTPCNICISKKMFGKEYLD